MKYISILFILSSVMVLPGCDETSNSVFNHYWSNDDVEAFSYTRQESTYYFLRQRNSDIRMEALIHGRLNVVNGCTVIEASSEQVTVIWPENFTLQKIEEDYQVAGEDIVIKKGDSIRFSGGYYSQVPETFCTGNFWLAGGELEVLE